MQPQLTVDSVRRKGDWTLRATVDGTPVLLHFFHQDDDAVLAVRTTAGKRLHRLRLDPSHSDTPPKVLQARYLQPKAKRGTVLYLQTSSWHYFYTFPGAADGWLSASSAPGAWKRDGATDPRGFVALRFTYEEKPRVWNGLSFVPQGTETDAFAEETGGLPARIPAPPQGTVTRTAVALFDRAYALRWVRAGKQRLLESFTLEGKRVGVVALDDDFTMDAHYSFLGAEWLDQKRRQGVVLSVKSDDTLRLHVFPRGFIGPVLTQDFSDSSTSISARDNQLGHDDSGRLIVVSTYSEPGGPDGTQGTHETITYHWNGRRFVETKK